MIEEYENLLNCKEHLREKLPILIEAFVSFYGEEKRKEIEEKFSKALIIAYRSPDSTNAYLRKIREIITKEIINKVIKEEHSSFTEEELTGKNSFEFSSLTPIYHYESFLEYYELGEEGRVERFKDDSYKDAHRYLPQLTREEYEEMVKSKSLPEKYSYIKPWIKNNLMYLINPENADNIMIREFNQAINFIQTIDPNITLENFSYYYDNEKIEDLNRIARRYKEMIEEYNSRMSKYSPYMKRIEEDREKDHKLAVKYHIKWVEENYDLLNEEDIKAFEEYKKNPESSYLLPIHLRKIFGTSIYYTPPFEAFSKESQEIIDNPKRNAWKRESLLKQRVNFFKDCGIDLGDDYEAYLSSEEAKKIWPDFDQVQKYIETRDKYLNEYNIEYYSNLPSQKDIRREIEERHLLDKDDPMNASLYTRSDGNTMVSPNLVKTNSGYDLCAIVAINCSYDDGAIDHNIVHELNHLYELSLTSASDKEYKMICGWEELNGVIGPETSQPLDTINHDTTKRNYELMNEILNEVIAQEVCQKLKEKQQLIFDNPEKVKYKYVTNYEQTFYIIRDFYQEFKKEIIESRSNGNINIILNKVGKENFDALNELFHIHYEHFSGFKYYSLIDSLRKKEDNEQTRIYKDIIRRRNEILDKMRKYSMLQENVNEEEGEKKKS